MLAIRMQRVGRKGHPQYRMVVQESRYQPTSGKVVAKIGTFDPHTKVTNIDKERAEFFLGHGAQPSDRVVTILKTQGIKMPSWVKEKEQKTRTTRHPDKLRRNQPPVELEPATDDVASEATDESTVASE